MTDSVIPQSLLPDSYTQQSEEKTAELSGDTSTEQHTSVPTRVSDAPVTTSLEVSGSFVPGSDALSQSERLPEGPAQFSPDPDSFSDSYAHITPSPDEPPASPLSTETLGGEEFTQEKERLPHEETLYPLNGEEPQQEGEGLDLSPRTTDLGKQAGMNNRVKSGHYYININNLSISFYCVYVVIHGKDHHLVCQYPFLYFVLFVFEVYLVDQLVMELFSIWARRLSGGAVVGMRQGA